MAAQVADPALRREQMAVALRRSKRQEILSKKRYSAQQVLSLAQEPVEQLDPFAAPPVTDLQHCFDFFINYPQATDQQYMELFESARRSHPGQEEEYNEA